MARGRAVPGAARGGEVVQAPRPDPPRLAAGAAAVACAGALAVFAAARADAWWQAGAAVGGVAVVALAAAIALRRAGAVVCVLFALGALYAATLRGDALDGWAVGYGAGLLLVAELAYGAIERDPLVRVERAVALRHAAAVCGLVAASLAAGLVVVMVAGLDVHEGLPLAAAGTAAAVGLLLVLARLARAR